MIIFFEALTNETREYGTIDAHLNKDQVQENLGQQRRKGRIAGLASQQRFFKTAPVSIRPWGQIPRRHDYPSRTAKAKEDKILAEGFWCLCSYCSGISLSWTHLSNSAREALNLSHT